MPSGTAIQQFINDLRDGKSKIARAFDDLFGDPQEWAGSGYLLNNIDPTQDLPGWAVNELKGEGSVLVGADHYLSDADIAHINAWAQQDKADIWETVRDAMQNNDSVQFFWEIQKGHTSHIDINQGKTITITFITPRSKVRFVEATGEVDIEVP